MSNEATSDHEMPGNAFREDDVRVQTQGKIKPPVDLLDHLGIEGGDLISVTLIFGDGDTESFNRKTDTRRRVTIPHLIRHNRSIEPGDVIDIEVASP